MCVCAHSDAHVCHVGAHAVSVDAFHLWIHSLQHWSLTAADARVVAAYAADRLEKRQGTGGEGRGEGGGSLGGAEGVQNHCRVCS